MAIVPFNDPSERLLSLDSETTGFDPETGDRIVEIGIVEIVNRVRTGNNFHIYINPERDMPAEAFKVHGLSQEFLKKHPVFAEQVSALMQFIGDSPLVIHNASFDMKFLNFELGLLGLPPLQNRVYDSLEMARRNLRLGRYSLDALCNYFKIDNSSRTLHGALIDADLLAKVFIELIGGPAYSFAFAEAQPSASGAHPAKPLPAPPVPVAQAPVPPGSRPGAAQKAPLRPLSVRPVAPQIQTSQVAQSDSAATVAVLKRMEVKPVQAHKPDHGRFIIVKPSETEACHYEAFMRSNKLI